MAPVLPLTSKDKAEWSENIANYMDRIEMQEREFSSVAQVIIQTFSFKEEPPIGAISKKIVLIDQMDQLSPKTKSCVQEKLHAIAEIYDEAELWIEAWKISALKIFILENIHLRANNLVNASESAKNRYRTEQKMHQTKVNEDQRALSEANTQTRKPSVLDEAQQLDEDNLFDYIHEEGLDEYRNPSLPLSEDLQLVHYLAKNPNHRSILNYLHHLYRDNKCAAMIILSYNLGALADFSEEVRADLDMRVAAALSIPQGSIIKLKKSFIAACNKIRDAENAGNCTLPLPPIMVSMANCVLTAATALLLRHQGFRELHACCQKMLEYERKHNREIILDAIKPNAQKLTFTSSALRSDRESALRSDREIVLAAMRQGDRDLQLRFTQLHHQLDVLAALRQDRTTLNDEEIEGLSVRFAHM